MQEIRELMVCWAPISIVLGGGVALFRASQGRISHAPVIAQSEDDSSKAVVAERAAQRSPNSASAKTMTRAKLGDRIERCGHEQRVIALGGSSSVLDRGRLSDL
jgi:hypothetical protein